MKSGEEADLDVEKMYRVVILECVYKIKEFAMYWSQKIENDVDYVGETI